MNAVKPEMALCLNIANNNIAIAVHLAILLCTLTQLIVYLFYLAHLFVQSTILAYACLKLEIQ
jgi:hypothetical protein